MKETLVLQYSKSELKVSLEISPIQSKIGNLMLLRN